LQHEDEAETDEHGDSEDEEDRLRAYGNDTNLGSRHVRDFVLVRTVPRSRHALGAGTRTIFTSGEATPDALGVRDDGPEVEACGTSRR
jgi:hypothetical protein